MASSSNQLAESFPMTVNDMNRVSLSEGAAGAIPFAHRHIGPQAEDIVAMLRVIGKKGLAELIDQTVPRDIRLSRKLSLLEPSTESDVLRELREIASKNKVFLSYIGHGYYDCVTPPVIRRNILENPAWYTQYTPYQAEISQGRLEALINFQTMVSDLTGMEIANASLLDEGTAAAEAMMMAHRLNTIPNKNSFLLSDGCHEHVIDVVRTRAEPLGINVHVVPDTDLIPSDDTFGILVSYPRSDGEVVDYSSLSSDLRKHETKLVVCTDLLALVLLRPPSDWGADIVVGSSQRFGVPMAYGGPHAAFFATRDEYRRDLPGRLIGVSKDANGKPAYRLALQTREQHIRRDKATSNICTAQVLLAVMAGMYAVYHGPVGLRRIAESVHQRTIALARLLNESGFSVRSKQFFDTIRVDIAPKLASAEKVRNSLEQAGINVRWFSDLSFGISVDEAKSVADIEALSSALLASLRGSKESTGGQTPFHLQLEKASSCTSTIPGALQRKSQFLSHPVFHRFQSETELLRYIRRLDSRDLSLTTSMIPLGSCTMKLNAAAEMLPITWPEFAGIHPFAPEHQALGYQQLFADLESMLAEITGLPEVSLQPNAGSQGEYAGLLAIRRLLRSKNQSARTVCLIPHSAHGTNPASAVMAGMNVVSVKCDAQGNVDLIDLRAKAEANSHSLACIMITYPSTHGVYEQEIREICSIVHSHQGLVYMDGANLNAQLGLCRPGDFGVDVCHLNLHKTFCIPHGGGGPGIGPIAVSKELAPFLPGHFHIVGAARGCEESGAFGAVSSAPWGSAGILPIPWVYIRLMGADGLKLATEVAILNANYIATRLGGHFETLYRGINGTVAHECILDLRHLKRECGLEAADIAKRLMDYGFHAPTVSFPVVETLMVEPTESESREELDRFCEAMILIRKEIDEVSSGKADKLNNVLKNAPHTAQMIVQDEWPFPYSREKAAFPAPWLNEHKFWPSVARIDNAYGDRNLFCSCIPLADEQSDSPVS